MPTTENGAPYPSPTDPNNIPGDLQALAEWSDSKLGTQASINDSVMAAAANDPDSAFAQGLSASTADRARTTDFVMDARLLPDGDGAAAVRSTTGKAFRILGTGGDLDQLAVTDGYVTMGPGTIYAYGQTGDGATVRHHQLVIDWPTGATGAITIIFTASIPESSGLQAGIHATLFCSVNGTPRGYISAGSYGTVAFQPPADSGPEIPFPGTRTVVDTYFNPASGRVQHFINGVQRIDYTEPAQIPFIGAFGAFEYNDPSVGVVQGKVAKFSLSSRDDRLPAAQYNAEANTPASDFTVPTDFGQDTTPIPAPFYVDVTYPASGRVIVVADFFLEQTDGAQLWGTVHGTSAPYYQLRTNAWNGMQHFSSKRTGTPGTTERVKVYLWRLGGGTSVVKGSKDANIYAIPA